MDPITVRKAPLYLAGMNAPLPPQTASPGERPRVIRELTQTFVAKAGELTNHVGAERYSVIERDVWEEKEGPVIWSMVAVESLKGLPSWCKTFVVEPGRFAVFQHKGPPGTMMNTVREIQIKWAPRIEGLFKTNWELMVYPSGYSPTDPNATFDYWLPLPSKNG